MIGNLKEACSSLLLRAGLRLPEQSKPGVLKIGAVLVAVGFLLVLVLIFRPQPQDIVESIDFGELPDFTSYTDIAQMKADFFDYLQPMVVHYNGQIRQQREQLQAVYLSVQAEGLQASDKEFIEALAVQYDYELAEGWSDEIAGEINSDPFNRIYRQLLLRVDEIPVDLALVQAAKESGWGRSRFAVEANNLFGQWCYVPGCGLVPAQRQEGATHEVRKFGSVADAIGSYMNNLNSHRSYDTFRLIRGGLRSAADPLTGEVLADGLIYYSERREAYVDEVKAMLRQYHSFQDSRQLNN